MLIALGLAIVAILFGAPQSDLLLSNMDKYVKKIVVDKNVKKQILYELKDVRKLEKTYQKRTKKYVKELKSLAHNKNTSKEQFAAYFEELVNYELETNKQYIPHRVAVQNALSEDEWDKIIDAGSKEFKKGKKANDKRLDKLKTELNKIEKNITKHIDDKKNKALAENILSTFNADMYGLAVEIIRKNPYEQEVLLNKNASEEDLFSVINEDNKQWMEMFVAFSALHKDLSELVPSEKWKPVSKELKKFIRL